jgi:gluconate 2-dehydrogenase gamma chain
MSGAAMIADTEAAVECRLGEAEGRTLRAIVRRVLPSDDGFGAVEAGCPEYVVQALEARLSAAALDKARHGLRFADDLVLKTTGRSFAEAEDDEQDRALRQLQLTPHRTLQDLVHRIVNLTLEGFLCHPRHGGNRDEVGWRYLEIATEHAPSGGGSECTTL